jgi:hypothetical protein
VGTRLTACASTPAQKEKSQNARIRARADSSQASATSAGSGTGRLFPGRTSGAAVLAAECGSSLGGSAWRTRAGLAPGPPGSQALALCVFHLKPQLPEHVGSAALPALEVARV